MSHIGGKAPAPQGSGTGLGITVAVGGVTPGRAYCMSDEKRDELLFTAIESDVTCRITRPSGKADGGHRPVRQDRRDVAATKLASLWRGALPIRAFPMAYGDAGRAAGACLTREAIDAAQSCWVDYCEAMNELARRCSQRHADAVREKVIYEDPRPLWRLVNEGLEFLASHWKLR